MECLNDNEQAEVLRDYIGVLDDDDIINEAEE